MSTMKEFYASLTSTSRAQNPYLRALAALTRIDTHQMKILAGQPGWQQWSEPVRKHAAS